MIVPAHWTCRRFPGIARVACILGVALVLAAAAPAAADNRVFIPTGSGGTVLVVDPASDSVIDRIEGLPAIHGLAATADGRYLVAGSFEERAPGSGAVEKPAAVSEEDHAAHHGGGSSAETDPASGTSTVSVVDVATRQVVRRIDVPGAVHHVAIDDHDRIALVTQPNTGSVTAIDLATFEVIATVRTGSLPNYAVFGADGNVAYVTNAGDDTVSVIDLRHWRVRERIAVGASPEHLVLSRDGSSLFVSNAGEGSVAVVSTETRQVVDTLLLGRSIHGLDLSFDDSILFVALTEEDKLVMLPSEGSMTEWVRLSPAPYHVTYVLDRDKVYVSSAEKPVVWSLSARTLEVLAEIPVPGIGHQMAQSSP